MFTKILIANRGEIACRVIRTAQRLGVKTVAVYSAADARARHVRLADEAVLIGPAPARESYLGIEAILAAARQTGAEAIHPGYGFLAENGDFAAACAQAGIVFIGPPATAIRAMGSKAEAKARMAAAGVPLVPGYHGENQAAAFLAAEAGKVGYPVLLKASAGGGGKGMRVVARAGDLPGALAACQREAISSFGDGRILIEKYLERPRHIEIQVFADQQGHCVHLFERDCSVQRRHQKVLEEAPAPGLTETRRREMGAAAVAAARAVNYVGAGTVEFIVSPDGTFAFMEMNTRLQVEHPVTEFITGLDLVEWQLRVAAGEPLPLTQPQLSMRGCALEARIYAEDAEHGFRPATGKLTHLEFPAASPHVRVDTGVEQGDEITPYYDPLIAKVIVWDEDRPRALTRLRQALAECRVAGVSTNVEFLGRVVAGRAFASGDLDTGLIERERDALFPPAAKPPREVLLVAALATLLRETKAGPAKIRAGRDTFSPWSRRDNWRLNATELRTLTFRSGETEFSLQVKNADRGWQLTLDGVANQAQGVLGANDSLRAEIDGQAIEAAVVAAREKRHIFLRGHGYLLVQVDALHHAGQAEGAEDGLVAPIPGRIVALLATPGVPVAKGTPLLILEAMKMELSILAPAAGVVAAFHFAAGASVTEGVPLLAFEPTK